MKRLKGPGILLFFLICISGQTSAQMDTVKFNRYYFRKCWTDSKAIVSSPFRWKSKDWTKLGVFIAAESSLMFADESVKRFAQDHRYKTLNQVSKHVLDGFDATNNLIIISGFFAYGAMAQNKKSVSTALLAFESFTLASLFVRIPKNLAGRMRPDDWRNEGAFAFKGPFHGKSFPSGHAAATFAVASVIANQYHDTKWVPVTAYSVAGLVGLSRIYDNKHWLTDVVAGAAVGTLVGNLVSHRSINSHLTVVPFGNSNFQGIKVVYALN